MTEADQGPKTPNAKANAGPDGQRSAGDRSGLRRDKTRAPFRDQQRRSSLQGTRTPDYLLIGHICADILEDGSVALGGTALYSALTAAQLGARVAVLTRGVFGQNVAGMDVPGLDQFADKIQIIVQDADVPTTFVNRYLGSRRQQHVQHWAGPIDMRGIPPHWRNAKIVHLGPIADEIDPRRITGLTTGFLGVTPQGWMRDWPRERGGLVTHTQLRLPVDLVNRIDCAIVSDEEIFQARDVIERVGERRMSVVTRGPEGATIYHSMRPEEQEILRPGAKRFHSMDLPGIDVKIKSLTGAGDVFAAAFFMKAAERTSSALEAGRFANAVAGLSLREVGVESVPTRREIEAALREEGSFRIR
jgi:sugar/nucleoside kinase (ribokinase family)